MSGSPQFDFNAQLRTEAGRKAARRLRLLNKVPAIVYGGGKKPQAITLEQKEVLKALSYEAVFSHVLTLKIDGKAQKVIIKALNRHHTKPDICHIDFYRIKAGEKITMNVPIHFLGDEKCPGIEEGGVISHAMNDIEIRCLPDKLPEFIEVDVSHLQLDHAVHLSEVKLPEGVELIMELTEEHDPAVASVHRPKIEQEPEEEATEEAEGEGEATEGETAEGETAETAETEQGEKASAKTSDKPSEEKPKG